MRVGVAVGLGVVAVAVAAAAAVRARAKAARSITRKEARTRVVRHSPREVEVLVPLTSAADTTGDNNESTTRMTLETTLPPTAMEPIFSGSAWAGTTLWTASMVLCDLLITLRAQVSGARVLELGSGLGLPGLVAACLGARHVTLTEKPPLVELLQRNVDLLRAAKRIPPASTSDVACAELDWTEPFPEDIADRVTHPDFVLVSDCIYQHLYGDSWRALAQVLRRVSGPETLILNSIERRKDDGVDAFVAYAGELGVRVSSARESVGPNGEQLLMLEMRFVST